MRLIKQSKNRDRRHEVQRTKKRKKLGKSSQKSVAELRRMKSNLEEDLKTAEFDLSDKNDPHDRFYADMYGPDVGKIKRKISAIQRQLTLRKRKAA